MTAARSRARRRWSGLLGVVLCGLPGSATLAVDASPSLTAVITPQVTRPDEFAVVELRATIPAGYHLYSMTRIAGGPRSLEITVEDERLQPKGWWRAPEPVVSFDARFGKAVEAFEGEVIHRHLFAVAGAATPGPAPISVQVRGQICDRRLCVAFHQTVTATLVVEPGAARARQLNAPLLAGIPFPPDRSEPALPASPGKPLTAAAAAGAGAGVPVGQGLWSFLLVAFLAGLGALATPCVFPMIPITVSLFSKHTRVSVRQSAAMAALYAASIIFCFTVIGVAVSAVFGAVGMQTLSASPAFNIGLFLLLAGFACNLFGAFEITLPSGLIAHTSARERALSEDTSSLGSQALGVVLMALTFTLVSFTCTVGFVGIVLAQAAKGHWFFPALGMLAFSCSFSIPFFLLALFPAAANRLRGKSGDWMVAIKVVLGFLELSASLKFLSNVDLLWHWGLVTRPLVLTFWAATFLVAAAYLLRVFRLPADGPDDHPRVVGPLRMMAALLMICLSIHAGSGIRDTGSLGGWLDGWLPPAVYPGDQPPAARDELPWLKDDLQGAFARGRKLDRPVLVDFTGYTCTNCRYMEASMFPRPAIRASLADLVLAQAFTDCDAAVCDQQRAYQLKRFDTAALPFYAIINPHDDTTLATFASSTNDPAEFAAFLQQGLRAYAGARASAPAEPTVVLSASGPAVDFSLPLLAGGGKWKLSRLRGRWVLINFWASWCGPCVSELEHDFPPAVSKAPWAKLVTITFEASDTRPDALAFARKQGLLAGSVALYGGPTVKEARLDPGFDSDNGLPASYLIAPDGHVAWKHHGSIDAALLEEVLRRTRPADTKDPGGG